MPVDLGPFRDLVLDVNQDFHGVPAIVTRPPPNDAPITTRGIWLRPLPDGQPVGTDYRNRQPRKVLVLARDQVPTVPKGTLIVAPDKMGGPNVNWQVDNYDPEAADDVWFAIVRRV